MENEKVEQNEIASEAINSETEVVETKKERKIKKLLSYNLENDIKYRGPLGIIPLKILAWAFLALSVLSMVISMNLSMFHSEIGEDIDAITGLISMIGQLSIPCFILVKLSIILKKESEYKRSIITYGAIALAIALATTFAYFHYALGLINALYDISFEESIARANEAADLILNRRFSFNIFMDMFLWSVILFFINYDFKYKGKKLILIRLCALIPFIYIVICFTLKVLYANHIITIPAFFAGFTPTVTPLGFIAFALITLMMRRSKAKYLKYGGTNEGYNEYVKTNANSLAFSIRAALIFVAVGIIDLILIIIISGVSEESVGVISSITDIGECIMFILFAPIIMLFSYTREYKSSRLDIIIPIVGVAVLAFIVVEGGFQIILELIKSFNFLL